MIERTFQTPCGTIHYWISQKAEHSAPQLVFLPGLTADHRLFDRQIEYFEGKYPLFVWDAPGHTASWPFDLTFTLADKAKWLDAILTEEGFDKPVIIGQSMGGYVGQMFAQLFPEIVEAKRYETYLEIERRRQKDLEQFWVARQASEKEETTT